MDVMVKLPRKHTGEEILKAFRNSLPIDVDADCQWIASGFSTSTGHADASTSFVSQKGFYATPSFRVKRGRIAQKLFGKKPDKWETSQYGVSELEGFKGLRHVKFESQITLLPLNPNEAYARVAIQAYRLYSFGGHDALALDYEDKNFAHIREVYEQILPEFLNRL